MPDNRTATNEELKSRVQAVVEGVARRRVAGEALSDGQVLAEFPDLAEALGRELAKLRLIEAAGKRADACCATSTADGSCRGTPQSLGRLRIHCSQCGEPSSLPIDPALEEAACAKCGNKIDLTEIEDSTSSSTLTHLAHFDLIERAGEGCFGTVWKAYDNELQRVVAVKVPHRSGITSDELAKVLREARAAAQLNHPNIVSVHEVGHEVGSFFIVSDYIAGVPLSEWLTGRVPTARQAAELCATIADALQHAHEQGVVHRDLKPANILIDAQGEPHITDFGLARREADKATGTMEGQLVGTPAYMSPEQAVGDGHLACPSSDIYSLGVILFQMLTGEMPFRGNVSTLIQQVVHDNPPTPRKLNPSVPRDLETITLKCMEKCPSQRYGAAELADELRRFLAGESILARPVGLHARASRWSRRHPAAILLGITTSVALVGSLAAVWFANEAGVSSRRADSRAEEALRHAEMRNQHELHARRSVCNAQLLRASEVVLADPALGRALLEDVDRCPLEWREFAWHLLHTQCGRERLSFRAHGQPVDYVGFLNNGKALVTVSSIQNYSMWDTATGQRIRAVIPDANQFFKCFSTDGTKVAWVWDKDDSVYVSKSHSPGEVVRLPGHTEKVRAAAFSPDGDSLVSASNDKTIRLWDLVKGTQQGILAGHESRVRCVAISGNGTVLASGDGSGSVKTWSLNTLQQLASIDAHKADVLQVSVSPNGKVVATCGADDTASLFDTQTGSHLESLPANTHTVSAVVFAPDGKSLAYAGNDRGIRLWDVDKRAVRTVLRGHDGPIRSLAFSPDGTLLASGSKDRSVILWDVSLPRAALTLREHQSFATCVAYSPDGDRLVSGDRNGKVCLWNAQTGALERTLADQLNHVSAVAFAPDGQTIAASNRKGVITLWDCARNGEASTLAQTGKRIDSVAFSQDGYTLASCGADAKVRLWDWKSARERQILAGHSDLVTCVSYSHDDQILASASRDRTIRLWDPHSGEPLKTLTGHTGRITRIAFSRKENTLASASDDGTIRLWKVRVDSPPTILKGHKAAVWDISFSPNGHTLASASQDHTIKLWDADTGQLQATMNNNSGWVRSIAFSPNGHSLASANHDGAIHVWHDGQSDHVASLPR